MCRKEYPVAEAEYEEIIQNSDLFFQKIQSFHSLFGTKFKIPVIGGGSLDLHRLFLEVTARGGVEKVIKDRKWKEIIGTFNFPSTLTSVSFVLRKYYLSLLYHFEQVYYFRKEVPAISLDDLASATPGNRLASTNVSEDGTTSDQVEEDPILVEGSTIVGTIEGKFDSGYLVSVKHGSEKFRGVLYHSSSSSTSSSQLAILQNSSASKVPRRRKRKKHEMALKDPSQPKAKKSGYNFFFQENYNMLKPSFRGQIRELTQKIGILWNRLTDAEKQVYQDKAVMDKERYETEMMQYQSSNNQRGQ